MVDYTLERKGNNQATYMMDIKDQAQLRFGKNQKKEEIDEGGAARADSAGEKKANKSSPSSDEAEGEDNEVKAAYLNVDNDDLNSSLDKVKGDTEGARRQEEPKRPQPKPKATAKRENNSKKGKVLTFVDMSHLAYLSKSLAVPSTALDKKKHVIPKDLK
jgi:hypothetical protein